MVIENPLMPPRLDRGTIANVVPFTMRENLSQMGLVESMRVWIGDELVPFIRNNIDSLSTEWVAQANKLISDFETISSGLVESVNGEVVKIGTSVEEAQAARVAAEQARDEAETYASNASAVQDSAINTIFQNPNSEFRKSLNGVFDGFVNLTTFNGLSQAVDEASTRLDSFESATNASLDVIRNDMTEAESSINSLEAGKADKSIQTIVESGRLSQDAIDERISNNSFAIIRSKSGSLPISHKFDLLKEAISDPTKRYRVCVLGSSSSNGAYTTRPEKAVFQRLSHRANAGPLASLDGVGGPVSGSGIKWWSGSQGNTTSANYFPVARRNALANVVPDMVIHMIGENDYFYGTTIPDYISNMESALSFIEGVNPNVLNVVVHSHGRNDVPSPAAPWDAYRDALASVAAAKPSNRYFIDAMEYFYPLQTMGNNIGGMLMDTVHPGDLGHKYLAKIIGSHLGIPDPDDYAGAQTWDYAFGSAAKTFATAGAVVGDAVVPFAVNYPREFDISGSLWIDNTNGNGYVNTTITDATSGSPIQSVSHSLGAPGAKSIAIADTMYVPPRVKPGIFFQAFPNGSVTIQGDANGVNSLSRVRVTGRPV